MKLLSYPRLITLCIAFLFSGFYISGQVAGFVENKGQWEGEFDFLLNYGYNEFYFNANEIAVRIVKSKQHQHHSEGFHEAPFENIVHGHVYKVLLEGANPKAEVLKEYPQVGYLNYIMGKNEDKWKGHIKSYAQITYLNVYPNIDLRYKLSNSGIYKYEFVVHPNGNVDDIKLKYSGLDTLGLLQGQLVLRNSVATLVEQEPIVYQELENQRHEISGKYKLTEGILSFDLSRYNKRTDLVIDPTIVFSTYTGSTADNWGFTATPGRGGCAYAGGIIFGSPGNQAYPTTVGAFQDSMGGGDIDIVISKFTADGSALVYSTYLGGTGHEVPMSLLETEDGSLIIMGNTTSRNFPITTNAFDTSFAAGVPGSLRVGSLFSSTTGIDVYIAILDSTGAALEASTFLGGSNNDGKNGNMQFNAGDEFRGDIGIDSTGNILIVTNTFSEDMPTYNSSNAVFQDTLKGQQDGFLISFNSDLSAINWSTYLGGTSNDALFSLALTNTKLYVTGATESADWQIASTGSYQSSVVGLVDGFVAEFNPVNGQLNNFTFLGTSQDDLSYFIDVDQDGNVYCFGQTYGDFPIVGDNVYQDSGSSQFITELNATLSQVLRSTVFGSGSTQGVDISPTALLVDDCKNVAISGYAPNGGNRGYTLINTNAPMPLKNEFQNTVDYRDFYFLVLDASWQNLIFASYFGDSLSYDHVDGGTSRFAKNGDIFQAVCAGCGGTSSFPTTAGAYSSQNNSTNCNMAVFVFDFQLSEVECKVDITGGVPDSVCIPYTTKFTDNSYNSDILVVQYPNGIVDTTNTGLIEIKQVGFTKFSFAALDTNCNLMDTTSISFYGIDPNVEANFEYEYDSCTGENIVFFNNHSLNADSYLWVFGDGDSSIVQNPQHQFEPGQYEVIMIAKNDFCQRYDTLYKMVQIGTRVNRAELVIEDDPCNLEERGLVHLKSTGFHNYKWTINGLSVAEDNDSIWFDFSESRPYLIQVELEDTICQRLLTVEESYFGYSKDNELLMPNVFTPNGDDLNDFFGPLSLPSLDVFTSYSLKVYDRRGLKIFETNKPNAVWDGNFNTSEMPDATYFYALEYQDICKRNVSINGFVHLMR